MVRGDGPVSPWARDLPALAQNVIPSSCNYAIRATPLPLTGWAVCRLLFTHCPWAKTTLSCCITYPTSSKCPASSANGWIIPNWEPGRLGYMVHPAICHLFLTRCCFHLATPSILTWSSICSTPWCQLWTPDLPRRQRTYPWLWAAGKGWVYANTVACCWCFNVTAMSRSVESRGHYVCLHQVAPRWKHCLLETERGFNLVFRNVLSEKFHDDHREVRSYHRDKAHNWRELQIWD